MARMTSRSPFTDRQFGVLLHPSSLPGHDDVGTLGAEA
jgi:4-alpha-glucanotransferase